MRNDVLTIGHSTHPLRSFIGLLLQHSITALCDVRSSPYSRLNPQFNREDLMTSLRGYGIKYVFLGKELGARAQDDTCYENGKVRYDRLASTDLFKHGLDRIRRGMKDYRLALMCAEKEPLECHRGILIARHLVNLGIDVQHVHADGSLETHSDALARLVRALNLDEKNMFLSRAELLEDAYRRQEYRIAYESGSDSQTKNVARSAAG